jgi:hypothetical protein
MADFTPTQGRYLSFIQAYIDLHGYPPAESEIAAAMCVSPPSVNQMVKTLEKKGLILRQPGQARSLQILVPEEEVPPWNARSRAAHPARSGDRNRGRDGSRTPAAPPANLYVLGVYLLGGPVSRKYVQKVISRVIEIRGDQTLDQLHQAIFEAYDRWEQHLYEFQLGKRPFDPSGPNYAPTDPGSLKREGEKRGDSRTTKLDDLGLKVERVFGYWFDFGDDWFHQVQVDRIERAIPTVTYPRVIERVGKSPPQYDEEDEP